MKIIKATVICLSLFVYATSNAQNFKFKEPQKEFKIMDTDNNGKVTKNEMRVYYSTRPNARGGKINAEQRFMSHDLNDDNIVSAEELSKGFNWKVAIKKYKKYKNGNLTTTTTTNNNKPSKETHSSRIIENGNVEENINPIGDLTEDMSLDEFKARFKQSKKKAKKKANKNKRARENFIKMDKDQNGYVDVDEMEIFYFFRRKNGSEPENAKKNFKAYDRNKDNKVTLDEIKKGMNWKLVKFID